MPIIDGQSISRALREEIKSRVNDMEIRPFLSIILVGDDAESRRYVNLKQKAIEDVGAQCQVHILSNVNTAEIKALVENLNQDPSVHGILVQLPLPPTVNEEEVIAAINPAKDVDGFHPLNLGLGFFGQQIFTSCASKAILNLVDEYIDLPQPRVLLVGHSLDLIKPLTGLFVGRGCPITVVPEWQTWIDCSLYQVVVLESGEPQSFSSEMFRDGTMIVDAGFHWLDGKTFGNAVTRTFNDKQGIWLLPVPGGLGPLLITMLMDNLVKAVGNNG